jgi:hypothetical protein
MHAITSTAQTVDDADDADAMERDGSRCRQAAVSCAGASRVGNAPWVNWPETFRR